MNKIFTISFVLLYSLLVIDASFSLHECMGELKHFTIGNTEQKCCCGHAMDNKCCDSEYISFEDGVSYEMVSSFLFIFYNNYFTTLDLSYYTLVVKDFDKSFHAFLDLPPPRDVDLYLRNCSFIYYS